MNDVVKLNYYMLDASQVQVIRNIRDKFVNVSHPPASTLVQVSKLFRNDILVEIEATAVIRKKQ
jgi:enamine deaminase RidA (YjgF/YER057c/UK114 family)